VAAEEAKALKTRKNKNKYPYIFGCYVDEGFERKYTRKFLQAVVHLQHYKGAMLLRVVTTDGQPMPAASAWLRGDDLDAMIALLREAKRVWLRAYRKAAREVAKAGRVAKSRHAALAEVEQLQASRGVAKTGRVTKSPLRVRRRR
jgi:hypothetical protein